MLGKKSPFRILVKLITAFINATITRANLFQTANTAE